MVQKRHVPRRHVQVGGQTLWFTLEDAFWATLDEIAQGQQTNVPALVDRINVERDTENLSSAIRLFVLLHLRREIATLKAKLRQSDAASS